MTFSFSTRAATLISIALLSFRHGAHADVMVGDKVCITGYIMDKFCIDLGTLLDDPSTVTLANPEKHSFHCVFDVSVCRNSGYLVLTDKNEDTGMHCLGYRLDDTDAVLAAGLPAGQCSTCSGDGSKPKRGVKATVRGTVMQLGDGSNGVEGTPILEDIEVLFDDSEKCAETIVDPVCMPSASTSSLATNSQTAIAISVIIMLPFAMQLMVVL